jgi:lysophospholipase L1-like esterase
MQLKSLVVYINRITNRLKTIAWCAIVLFPMGCRSLRTDDAKPKITAITIVAFGDSITAPRKSINKVFAQRLPDLLAANNIHANVINSGIGGSHSGRLSDNAYLNIKHGLDRFEDDVLKKNPNLVLIGFGTNDAYIDSNKAEGNSRISTDLYRANLAYMINSLQKRAIKVILIAPNPLGKKRPDFQNSRLFEYVKVLRELSKKYRTGLVDNYQSFMDFQRNSSENIDHLMLDSVHPSDRGHEIIAANILVQILDLTNH